VAEEEKDEQGERTEVPEEPAVPAESDEAGATGPEGLDKVEPALRDVLLAIQEEWLRRDTTLGELSQEDEFSEFIFNIADTANTARAIKDVCIAFDITMDEFFAAFGFNQSEDDEDEDEEGDEEYGDEEGDDEPPEEPEPPKPQPAKRKGRPALDPEFIKP
jgi:hypothetical protein